MKRLLTLVFSALLLTACGEPSVKTLNSLNYGTQPKKLNMASLKRYLNATLKDPYSAKIDIFNQPNLKGYIRDKHNKIIWSGWVAKVHVNAKNSYGAYTGGSFYYVPVDRHGNARGLYNISGFEVMSPLASPTWLDIVGEDMGRLVS